MLLRSMGFFPNSMVGKLVKSIVGLAVKDEKWTRDVLGTKIESREIESMRIQPALGLIRGTSRGRDSFML